MKNIYLIHLGIGKVGRNLVNQIMNVKDKLRDRNLINLIYCGLYNSRGGYFDSEGIDKNKLTKIPDLLEKKKGKYGDNDEILNIIEKIHQPFILIDTTASEKTFPVIFSALVRGGCVVLSNKKVLTLRQEQFDLLHQLGKDRLFYETCVGAALPIISTLKDLIDTGDEILEIKGCLSGTLGFLFSQLDNGERFSEVVLQAKELGFTEPDPRDDLSGTDVARKAIILARIIGLKIELSDIKLEKLYKKEMENLSIDEFLKTVNQMDDDYKKRFEEEKDNGKTIRFIANISSKGCKVGMESVAKDSDLGSLKGPDNMIVFKTRRYFDHPLVIKGPGAGPEVTASGVFADILKAVKIL